MSSSDHDTQLDALLEEFAIENPDWPDSPEEVDQLLLESPAVSDDAESQQRVRAVLQRVSEQREKECSPTPTGTQKLLWDVGDVPASKPAARRNDSLVEIVRDAYLEVFDGYSMDRVIADPDRNCLFIQACWSRGAGASQYELNRLLLNARKASRIGKVEGVERYVVPAATLDQYMFASEVALRVVQDETFYKTQRHVSLDGILCEPVLGKRFQEIAETISPGFNPVDYRWAALCIRKRMNRGVKDALPALPTFDHHGGRKQIRASQISTASGFFWMKAGAADFYIGHSENLREQCERLIDTNVEELLASATANLLFDPGPIDYLVAPFPGYSASRREPIKAELVRTNEPKMNFVGGCGNAA